MGEVYKAHDEKLDRFVALKFLPHSFSRDEEQKARLLQEARAASAIDDINIASVHDVCETPEGNLYLVMGYYEGETLQAKLKRGRLPVEEAIDIAFQVARGMSKAHERGIIHRDIKPANIFITTDGTVKIIDFGLATGTFGMHLTRSGTSVGTVAYMSPEQMRGEEVTFSTDIWSLGVTIYEMLAGVLPFRGDYETAMMYSIANETPQPVSSFRQDIPIDLEMIIDKSMKKDQKERYQKANELAEALRTLRKKMDTGLESDTFAAYLNRTFYNLTRKHKLKLIIGAGIIAVAIGFVLYKVFLHPASVGSPNRSIAVLPFLNMGDTTTAKYVHGFAEDIYADISRASSDIVVSPENIPYSTTSGKTESVIASQLGARYLAEGQLLMTVSSVKFTITLFDAEKNERVFAKEFSGNRSDLFALKTTALSAIMNVLDLPFNPKAFYWHQPPSEVYEAYLNGKAYSHTSGKDVTRLSLEYFSEAASKDSLYLPALKELVRTKIEEYRLGLDKSAKSLNDASSYCNYVLRHDSADVSSIAMLGAIADLRGDHVASISLLSQSLEKSKNNEYALTMLSWIYSTELNKPEKAVIYLQRLQEFHPLDWMMVNNLGMGYAQIKDYDKAILAFRHASHLNPTHEYPPYSLAYTYERLGKADSAIIYYKQAIRNNPKFVFAYEGLVDVSVITRNYLPAESLLTAGLRQIPGDYKMFYYLGLISLFEGKPSAANRFLNEGLQLSGSKLMEDKTNGDLLTDVALFQARLGQVNFASENLMKAIRLDPSEDIAIKISRTYAVLKKKKEMLDWFHRAKAMNPEYDAAYLRTALDFENYRSDPDLLLVTEQ